MALVLEMHLSPLEAAYSLQDAWGHHVFPLVPLCDLLASTELNLAPALITKYVNVCQLTRGGSSCVCNRNVHAPFRKLCPRSCHACAPGG